MLWSLLQMDKTRLHGSRKHDLKTLNYWAVSMLLTNATLLPYLACRANSIADSTGYVGKNETAKTKEGKEGKRGLLSKAFGIYGLSIGLYCIYYFFFFPPAMGEGERTFAERIVYFMNTLHSERVAVAFTSDILIFYSLQIFFVAKLDPKSTFVQRYLPFFGLGLWLLESSEDWR